MRDIILTLKHIAGVENMIADRESRHFTDPKLNPSFFHRLQRRWGQMKVDIFAARHNHQLPIYYSYRPDPGARAVDAFT